MPSYKKRKENNVKAKIGVKKAFNPFEVRVNRKKHNVLGQKSKSEVGKPGISRSRSIQKRKKTLLQEYKQKNKSNQLVDKRFGEKDPGLSVEDKLMQRFVLERKRRLERSGRFNLGDDNDTLTHYGQSIGEMTEFDHVPVSDEDEEEAEDYSEANFGGFMKKKRPRPDQVEEEEDEKKSRKQILQEIVANSKHMKYERQSEKMEMENLMASVDSDWRDVQGGLLSNNKGEPSKVMDDFDKAVRELQFERRGHASNRMKTEEELAAEEKERLEKLEADRLRRMKGLSSEVKLLESEHVSGDFMRDPGCQAKKKDTRILLRYEDGKAVLPLVEGESGKRVVKLTDNDDTDGEEEAEEEEEEEEEEEGDEGEEEEEEEEEGEEEETEEEEEGAVEGLDEEEEDDDENGVDFGSDLDSDGEQLQEVLENSDDKLRTRSSDTVMRQAAAQELPYTFTVPKTLEELRSAVDGRSPAECLTAIQRIHSCNHPSLSASNKKQLEQFLPIMLDYCVHLSEDPVPANLETLDKLVGPLFLLCKLNAANSSSVFQKALGEKHKVWSSKRSKFPGFSTLLLFQLVGVVFSVSDFKHPVATPVIQFMGQILTKSQVRSKSDLLHGMLLCEIMLKYVRDSKRLVPELVNFLASGLAVLCDTHEGCILLPPFPSKPGLHEELADESSKLESKKTVHQLVAGCYSCDTGIPSASRDVMLSHLLDLVLRSFQLYKNLLSFSELFSTLIFNLLKLAKSSSSLSEEMQEKLESTLNTYRALSSRPRHVLTMLKQKPKSINFYEPKFDVIYDSDRRKPRGRSNDERQKLQYKLKKEMKGAVREIRRDTSFLAKVKLDETLALDAERKKKTSQLLNELQGQQHETKMEKRRTKRR